MYVNVILCSLYRLNTWEQIPVSDLASRLLLQVKAWEEAEMDQPMEIDEIRVDPSPFQLVERTSLHKVRADRDKVHCNSDIHK